MRWHQGSIPEAVAEAKRRQAIFLVFISGDDDDSKKMCASLESSSVENKIGNDSVALKLEANSESVKQFSQIYPVVIIPSTFFIGNNGVPIEVIGGSLIDEQLHEKINRVLDVHKQQVLVRPNNFSTSSNIPAAAGSSAPLARDLSPSPVSQEAANSAPLEERIERAKQLASEIREKKLAEEEEKEKLREIERRKLGREVQKNKLKQQEQEVKQIADEIAKEKAEEKAARERIKEQIARDRAERAAKFSAERAAEEKKKAEALQAKLQQEQERAATDAANRSRYARLQFRLPDGSSSNHQFEASSSLSEVHDHVREHVKPPFGSFTLSVAFPKREFQKNDYSQSLRDLQLAPTATILVLPVNRMTVSSPSGSGGSLNFIWLLLSPLLSLWQMLRVFLFGSAPTTRASSENRARTSQNPSTSRGPQQQGRSSEDLARFGRRDGNIYRIGSANGDDDDENNTWNGNSTQQM